MQNRQPNDANQRGNRTRGRHNSTRQTQQQNGPNQNRNRNRTRNPNTNNNVQRNDMNGQPNQSHRNRNIQVIRVTSVQFITQLEDYVVSRNTIGLHDLIVTYTAQEHGIVNLECNISIFTTFINAISILNQGQGNIYRASILSILDCQIFQHLFIQRTIQSSENSRSNYQFIQSLYIKIGPTSQLLSLCQQQINILQQVPNSEIAINFKNFNRQITTALHGQYDYKTCPIYPCQNDFISNQQSQGQIIRVKTTQPYQSISEYLNNNFYIIREELLANLRTAIYSLQQTKFDNIDAQSVSSVNIYSKVKMIDYLNTNNGIELQLEFEQCSQRGRQVQKINWKQTKRINSGYLVILTTYQMYPLVFCTIQENKVDQRQYDKSLRIKASFTLLNPEQNLHNLNIVFNSHRMPYLIEYPQLYEPTYRYLSTIQNADIYKYPFQQYLINGENITLIPKYSNVNMSYKIDLSGRKQYNPSKVQIHRAWPALSTSLDPSQLNAVKCMLMNQISIIQGPPGTGKTHCGTLGVRVLLENRREHTPIVMVCYTNHALDQFLLKLLNYVDKSEMVRVGNQSKDEILQELSLKNLRQQQKLDNFNWKLYKQTKEKLDCLLDTIIVGASSMASYKRTSVYWSSLPQHVVRGFLRANRLSSNNRLSQQSESIIFDAWINYNTPNSQNLLDRVRVQEQLEGRQLIYDNQIPIYVSTQVVVQYVERDDQNQAYESQQQQEFNNSFNELITEYEEVYMDSDEEDNAWYQSQYQDEEDIIYIQQRIIKIKTIEVRNLQYNQDAINAINSYINGQGNIWLLSSNDVRHMNTYCCYLQYQQDIISFREQYLLFKELNQQKKAQNARNDVNILQSKKIIGLTVTGVAVYQEQLNALNFKIMIIEEAAEVLEAHLAAILHPKIEHLILIGDHKQLRPKVSSYDLEKKYQCNISMFERFILMNMEYVTLQHQRRMKTEFADFIRLIYGNTYQDHQDVHTHKNQIEIKGIKKSLLFFDYREKEKRDSNSSSTSNPFEANMIANFVNYLFKSGYKQTQICVISMYTKQVVEIMKSLNKLNILEVKVRTVDNFQGEENDIIILSLVRSNTENRIGFLSNENRINVALSRAKLGLFVFGNFLTIQKAALRDDNSHILVKIINLALEKQVLLDHIPLVCTPHQRIRKVSKIQDWNAVAFGTCGLKCELPYPCGHKCQKLCHLNGHPQSDCKSKCGKQLRCPHRCEQLCNSPCTCLKESTKQLQCGHQQRMKCVEDPINQICISNCSKNLQCGHQCQQLCKDQCKCFVMILKQLPCGHHKEMLCCEEPRSSMCVEQCNRPQLCGHQCRRKCNYRCKCPVMVLKQLECGHKQNMRCSTPINTYVCLDLCIKPQQCGHSCTKICHEQCICEVVVDKILPCGHMQTMKCSDSLQCIEMCERTLDCGHKCRQGCKDDCRKFSCDELVMSQLVCGHTVEKLCSTDPRTIICQKQSLRTLSCGHQLYLDCKLNLCLINCQVELNSVLLCGHDYTMLCCDSNIIPKCMKPCERLRCDHQCTQPCWETCQSCQVLIPFQYPECKHIVKIPCGSYGSFKFKCKQPCNKILECGHINKCTMICQQACTPCEQLIDKQLQCGHTLQVLCYEKHIPQVCKCRCYHNQTTILACGHLSECAMPCGAPCSKCTVNVNITLKCGHQQSVQCFRQQTPNLCRVVITLTLKCGHLINIYCHEANGEVRKCKLKTCIDCIIF